MRASLAAVGGIVLGLTSLAAPLQAEQASLPREEVERIVRDYLLREPEILVEALEALQQRRQIAEAEAQKDALAARAGELFEDPSDPVVNEGGDVTVVEFFDYRCPYCRNMVPELVELLDEDRGLRVVFKEIPILGEESRLASRAALAAARQDKYMAMHEALMSTKDFSEAGIEKIAKEIGLDVARLKKDMGSEEISRKIEENLALASELGINGTPSFIIGETLIPGAVPVARLAQLVEAQRAK
ncbi:DsbA family protein [Marinimicrococcus flavescens]|uniref:DsbA family protein n=1 Tax=Marinimicrococcus flavescens TaxID=3031815 RepID=A0AAP3UZ73_9PROT|nr:DsbA family protein [Marinimicrococcus flavescens]